jgi:Glycosyl transferase family 2
MKIVMTVVLRDELDLVDDHLAFHLNAGVDFVIATDHRSVDGTTDILETYARDGVLRLIREEGDLIRQDVWQTRMSRLAATEHGAEWILCSDADEFWWPRVGSLSDALGAVPPGYQLVRAHSHSFLPRQGPGSFAERMTIRLAPTAPINDPATPYRPVAKVAFRADPRIRVGWGNHHLSGVALRPLHGWCPIDILHFPVRSAEQIARKYWNKATAWTRNPRGDLARARAVLDSGESDAIYERLAIDDATVARGLAAGVLVEDMRLRDALRTLRSVGHFSRDHAGTAEPHSALYDQVPHAVETGVLDDADLVRIQRRVDAAAARVQRLAGV